MSGLLQSMRYCGLTATFIATVPGPGLAAGETEVVEGPATFGSEKPQSSTPSAIRASESTGLRSLEPVVVTGSRFTRTAEEQSAQEVLIYDRARIERSGQSTVADFLATIPQVSLNSLESTFGATSVRLRGAPEGSALILINGRRTMPVTGSVALIGFFDLNTIPLSMIERIEVLPNGSSAIYGGEALAGVVNIVLRSGFQGAEASVGYKWARNTDEKVFYAGGGWKDDASKLSMIVSHSERSSLSGSDRDLTANSDFRRFGGPNLATPFFGSPANISSVSGNLPGLNSSFAAVPRGSTGMGLVPSDFSATAGTRNFGSFNFYQQILNASDRTGLFASAEHRLGNNIELFAELLASRYSLDGATTPPFLLQTAVPASNAFNPFGTTVLAAGVVKGAENLAKVSQHENFVRPLVGARGKVGTWEWELTALYSRDRGDLIVSGEPNTAALTAALASSNPATALNPFVDGSMGSPQLLASIYREAINSSWKGDATVTNGFARGTVTQLPAGPLDAVIGAEFERGSLQRGMDASRSARAAFGELHAPLLAGKDERGAKREVLAVQGALRLDRYSDFGGEPTWQTGVEFRPAERLLLRGTHATAFKPPTLFNLGAPVSSGSLPVTDPLNDGQSVIVQTVQHGNPQLDPTTSESSTLGVVWSPREVRNLNLSLTAWKLRIVNAVKLPGTQFIVNNESLFPGRVVRAPALPGQTGQIVSVDASYINFGSIREAGFDFGGDWTVRTPAGLFTPAFALTYLTEFEGTSTPGSPSVNRLSRANLDGVFAPRVKGIASIGWTPNATFKASLTGRYVGRYYDYTPPRTIGDFWYLDGALEVALGKGFKLLVTSTNLADYSPPFSTYFRGYDVYNYDIVGRTIFARLQWQI
jgi:iron complex outermembrane recepter protein